MGGVSSGASGGVSVKAGASPKLGGRSALRRAQRRAMVRQSRQADDLEVPAVACAQVCADCGQLGWPHQSTTASPHRSDADDAASLGACDHCQAEAWIDLSLASTALALRDTDASARAYRFGEFQAPFLLGGLFLGVALGTYLFIGHGVPQLLGTFTGLLGVALGHLVSLRWKNRVTTQTSLPHRWSFALPPAADASVTTHEGPLTSTTEELLRSPVTGRACLAYEVCLRGDGDDGGPLGSWEFVEQRIAACRVDGMDVDPSTTHLSVPRTRVATLSTKELDEAAMTYFRQRGYSPGDEPLDVYESTLEPGARVVLQHAEQRSALSPAVQALVVTEA